MKFCLLSLALAGCFWLAGCFSLSVSKEPGSKNHILVSNYGWYLFNSVPLVGGNASENPTGHFAWFRDDVTMKKIQRRLMDEAEAQGRPVENLVWTNYDSVLFSIPFVSIPFPIPYILTYREMQLSGELK